MIFIAVAIILAAAALGAAFGMSLLGSKLLETSARQPELAPALQTKFFIIAGLVEAIPIMGVGISLILIFVVA
ncbi:F0F1 ATP synthase subunit C [Marinimicrobium sp. ABcell2]|jgi:F-type H+-transporting ATPase subunit c|uniref:F0F1 ATP synthase subunit C n=1 Tax=Marinimicrobium sp. ABcell2 TaxID=3069751 RepID=UPI0027AE8A50|nr:F0F1 ATP synthase subunit C [Marinimicrobium sp. ABcell2]MDQ2077027.1 F0F1 ATP synthase subunit C [Marinimicrobium sp. ABcell2]